MGFSLKRALAGAIAGGAGAVGGIADARIKEAQQERERQQAFERQRELLELQDEIAAQREQRVEASKQRLEDAKIERMGGFMKDSLASLRESGIDPGSALGQRKLAELALENKQPALADRFFDNANRMDEMKDRSELRKMELGNRMQIASLRRGSSTAGGNDYTKGLAYAGKIGARLAVTGRDGKPVKVPEGASYMESLFRDAVADGMTPEQALGAVNEMHTEIAKGLQKTRGVNPLEVIEPMIDVFKANGYTAMRRDNQPPQNAGTQQFSTVAPKAAPGAEPEKRTPSVFQRLQERFSGAASMGADTVIPKTVR